MKRHAFIGFVLLLALAACHTATREAKRMLESAAAVLETRPDNTLLLIDSLMRTEAPLSEKQRMNMTMLQGEALFGHALEPDFDKLTDSLSDSPDLEHAADYFSAKKAYTQAAKAALFNGYVQQDARDKNAAMQSFKQAEHYAVFAADSLTLAKAQYHIGKMLYDEGLYEDALTLFQAADQNFDGRKSEKAWAYNMMAVSYILMGEYDSAEVCLKQSLGFSEQCWDKKIR